MKAISIYTTGAFLYPVKVTDSSGNMVWLWAVSQFEDDSFYLGETCNPVEKSATWEELLLPDDENGEIPEHDAGTDQLVCEQCGSTDVETRCWCDANTGNITDRGNGLGKEDCWCGHCGEHVYLVFEKEYLKNSASEE
jgi:hypothetical protein